MLGLGEVDEDHRELVELTNRALATLHDGLGSDREEQVTGEIVSALKAHFRHEERLMEACDYPGRAAHRANHDAYLRQVDELIRDYRNRRTSLFHVADTLLDWIFEHIEQHDAPFVQFLLARAEPAS